MQNLKLDGKLAGLTVLADVFLVWVLVHYGMGGWANGVQLLLYYGRQSPLPWLLLGLVLFLLLYRSDYRSDLLLFAGGWLLGYWGEWWGTTRGVWTYWNHATPPDYLPPLWGLGVITVYRLGLLLAKLLPERLPTWSRWALGSSFVILPPLAALLRLPWLAQVDWRGRLDEHFVAGLLTASVLALYRFDLRRDFPIYLCGMLLGGLYEYLGTVSGEWTYITGEIPPLWIVPLWGMAAVAMTHLSFGLRRALEAAGNLRRSVPGG